MHRPAFDEDIAARNTFGYINAALSQTFFMLFLAYTYRTFNLFESFYTLDSAKGSAAIKREEQAARAHVRSPAITQAPRATRHAPRAMRHAPPPRTTLYAPRATRHAPALASGANDAHANAASRATAFLPSARALASRVSPARPRIATAADVDDAASDT